MTRAFKVLNRALFKQGVSPAPYLGDMLRTDLLDTMPLLDHPKAHASEQLWVSIKLSESDNHVLTNPFFPGMSRVKIVHASACPCMSRPTANPNAGPPIRVWTCFARPVCTLRCPSGTSWSLIKLPIAPLLSPSRHPRSPCCTECLLTSNF
jgi:hypothetical protein